MDIRDGFFYRLIELAKKDRDILVVANDMGAFGLNEFRRLLPKQFINGGISEQNIISVSAGLALSGKKVFVYGITPFVTARCYEQIKNDIVVPNIPITIVGSGPGISYSADGPTHQSSDDIGLMRLVGVKNIFTPIFGKLSERLADVCVENREINFVRLDKGDYKPLYDFGKQLKGFGEIQGNDAKIAIVSNGVVFHELLVKNKDIMAVSFYDVYKISKDTICRLCEKLINYDKIIVAEESFEIGSLANMIKLHFFDRGIVKSIKSFNILTYDSNIYGTREFVREQIGYSLDEIVGEIIL